jgi:hypothetical protein
MTLRTRLILVVMATILLLVASLIAAGWLAQNKVEDRLHQVTISS